MNNVTIFIPLIKDENLPFLFVLNKLESFKQIVYFSLNWQLLFKQLSFSMKPYEMFWFHFFTKKFFLKINHEPLFSINNLPANQFTSPVLQLCDFLVNM